MQPFLCCFSIKQIRRNYIITINRKPCYEKKLLSNNSSRPHRRTFLDNRSCLSSIRTLHNWPPVGRRAPGSLFQRVREEHQWMVRRLRKHDYASSVVLGIEWVRQRDSIRHRRVPCPIGTRPDSGYVRVGSWDTADLLRSVHKLGRLQFYVPAGWVQDT